VGENGRAVNDMSKYFLFLMIGLAGCSSDAFESDDGGDGGGPGDGGQGSENSLGSDASMDGGVGNPDGSSADGASVDGGDGSDGSVLSPYRRVFITSGDYSPNFGGLSGADGTCNSLASGAGLGGTWAAWLSSSNVSAGSRLEHASVPYKLLDGTVVASNWSDLISGSLQHPIDRDEHNKIVVVSDVVPYSGYAWTGTGPDGGTLFGFGGAQTCDDWMYTNDGGISPYGIVGGWPGWDGGATDIYWTQSFDFTCKTAASISLYCIEQP